MRPPVRFASPMEVSSPDECSWYHTFEWPDGSLSRATWDFRECLDDYLGHFDYQGKSVLEIGPASGFFTVAMEQRGASVVCIENDPQEAWEAVPRADLDVEGFLKGRREGSPSLWKSWWYAQQVYGGSAKVIHCGVAGLGNLNNVMHFDVCFIGAVLAHLRHPVDLLYDASRLADVVIITERWRPALEAFQPPIAIAGFKPHPTNETVDGWWELSSTLMKDAMAVFGFRLQEEHRFMGYAWKFDDADITQDTRVASDHLSMVFVRDPSITRHA